MPSYETLDTIADAYTPLLALACLALLVRPLGGKRWQAFGLRTASLATGMLIAYGLMFLDEWLRIWPATGLDYSTHTAVALILAMFISANSPKARLPCWLSLLAYALLMLYQCYHTAADIGSTAAMVGALYLPVAKRLRQEQER